MRHCKGKVMLSINDHPAIRDLFSEFPMHETTIRYSNHNQSSGGQQASKELVIMNWDEAANGQLF